MRRNNCSGVACSVSRKSYFVPFAIVAAGVLKYLKGFFVMCRQSIFLCWVSGYFFNIPVVFENVGES